VTVALLAVDGGNSKTDLALLARNGTVLAAVRGGTTSHQAVGAAEGGRRLEALVAEAARRAGIAWPASDGAAGARAPLADLAELCVAGMDLGSDARQLRATHGGGRLARELDLHVDAAAALRAGAPDGWGVAVILGAGINAIGVAPGGREVRFAALGDISGDRGGGGDLGMWALGAAVRARDGRGPRTSLERLVPAHFGLRRPLDVTIAVYTHRFALDRLDELAAVAVGAAANGDAVALGLLAAEADEAAAWAVAAIRRAGLVRRAVPVVLAGGLARGADPLLTGLVADRVRAVAPHAVVSVLHAPPVLGAALLGLDRLAPGDAAAAERARAALTVAALDAAMVGSGG
jgi:N-acetylglucosamine kinase-like BadF-type ATPase